MTPHGHGLGNNPRPEADRKVIMKGLGDGDLEQRGLTFWRAAG